MFGWFKRLQPRSAVDERTWRDAALFRGLDAEQLEALAPHVRERSLGSGEELAKEGEPAAELFLLRSGRLELYKRDPQLDREVVLDAVDPWEVVGEVALFDQLPRLATARAVEDSVVYAIAFSELRPTLDLVARSSVDPRPRPMRRAYHKLLENLARVLADRLRENADQAVLAERQRAAVGAFLINILVLLCLYSFMLRGLAALGPRAPASSSVVSIPLQLLFAFGSWRFIRSTGYPLADFGLSSKHLLWSLLEAAFFTAPLCAALTGVKWLALWLNGNPHRVPLVEHPDVMARLQDRQVIVWLSVYAATCLVQELIVRSALQSSLQKFLAGPRSAFYAVVITALLFAMTHLHMSFLFAALAFVPGLFWGWLFARRPNLAGVTLSHIVVGGYVFFIMGVRL